MRASGAGETAPGLSAPSFADSPTMLDAGLTAGASADTTLGGLTGATLDPDETHAGTGGRMALDATGALIPGQNFGERYHIVRLLGVGGMGAVYQAWDADLGVLVALKVIRPEAAADPAAAQALERRFKQELLLARQVTHKNVVRIHDMGELQGIKYITMPYIEGQDLASVLEAEKRLAVPRALKIARTMVSGLAAAHAAGVVHRDLKPANIMVDADGEALIMDFGIARSTGTPAASAVVPGVSGMRITGGETVVGAIVGTVQYMAPEQARGQLVDHRADIYAAGLIMYDMLAGRRRHERAESALGELTSRTVQAPPPLRTIDPAIPPALEAIVNRCVQPGVDQRYATTGDLIADLDRLDSEGHPKPIERRLTRRLAAAIGVSVLALLAGTWWIAQSPPPPAQTSPVSVLIADFANTTGDPVFTGAVEQGLGIAMEGASFVSAYPRPRARQVAEQLRPGASLDETMARLVARREALNVVIAGSIAASRGGYQIEARALDMTRTDTEEVLAAASVAAAGKADILPAVERLAADLRRRLGDTADNLNASAPSETFTAASLDAMREYVRGQDLQVAGKFDEALDAYRRAVSFDEGFGRAYAGMGVVYGNRRQFDKAEESYQRALKHLNRMTEREKFATLGGYYLLVSHDYARAIDSYKQLVEKYPADRAGHANLAYAYLNVRNLDGAVSQVREALALEPGNVLQRMNYAMYSLYASDFTTAIEESRRIPGTSGLRPYALFTEARAKAAGGDLRGGRAVLDQLKAAPEPGPALALVGAIDLSLMEGRYGEAVPRLRAEVATQEKAGNRAEAAAYLVMLGEAYQALGDRAGASAAAARAAEYSRLDAVLLPAGLLFAAAGESRRADAIIADLEGRLQGQSRSYARLIRGELERRAGKKNLPAAVEALREAQQRYDSWFAHLLLGLTYFEYGDMPSALAEFDACVKRRGEVSDVFFSDSATLRYLPPAYYWLARAQEATGNPEAAGNYERYLQFRGQTEAADPLVADARRRLASR